MRSTPLYKILRRRRVVTYVIIVLFVLLSNFLSGHDIRDGDLVQQKDLSSVLSSDVSTSSALSVLDGLQVRGRAQKTGYSRSQFSDGWARIDGCDVRNLILQRDLNDFNLGSDQCVVLNGLLNDPYTGAVINFTRGSSTSDEVQIDHVVALSDAWQKGAQGLSESDRLSFANDSLNLLAVDGPANQQKGASDAASWLPSSKSYRCRYVARQVAVKSKYSLWVTSAEQAAMRRVLNGCKGQVLPVVEEVQEE